MTRFRLRPFLRYFFLLSFLMPHAMLASEPENMPVADANVPGGTLPDQAATFPAAPGTASSLSIDGRGALAFPEPEPEIVFTDEEKKILEKLNQQTESEET